MQRAAPDRVVTFAELYRALMPGELLSGTDDPRFREARPPRKALEIEGVNEVAGAGLQRLNGSL
jgi:hypothetical protein